MEDKFYRDELEDYLKEQADSHRLYPSDAVWRNIDKQLHGEKQWPALPIAAFIIFIMAVAVSVHFLQKPNLFAIQTAYHAHQPAPGKPALANAPGFILSELQIDNQAPYAPVTNQPARHFNATSAFGIINKGTEEVAIALPQEISVPIAVQPLSLEHIAQQAGIANAHDEPGLPIEEMMEAATTGLPLQLSNINIQQSLQPNIAQPTKKQKRTAKSNSKLSYQIYLTPSFSYRKLRESSSKEKAIGEGPVALNLVANVNQIVRHKPGHGLEAGGAILYEVIPGLRVKTGLQLNVRQYFIQAYRSPTEMATITLHHQSGVDTINALAQFRTTTGMQNAEITNRYFQVAVPFGIDLELVSKKRVQLNIAASIQPTYQINSNVYTLSSNLKNYTQTNDMLQRWNINSSLEAYLSYRSGDYKIQVGPQVRYQHLPSMVPQYAIREYLLDYGVKVGVSKAIR